MRVDQITKNTFDGEFGVQTPALRRREGLELLEDLPEERLLTKQQTAALLLNVAVDARPRPRAAEGRSALSLGLE